MSTMERDVLSRSELDALVREREEELAELKVLLAEWEQVYEATPKRKALFSTVSGREVKPLYTSLDRPATDDADALGVPGFYPFTRGPYATMYRTRLWTKRQFAGFASAADTNRPLPRRLRSHAPRCLRPTSPRPTIGRVPR
jgi:methylmalonyl-CoA mutase N-terminal domain/subunit